MKATASGSRQKRCPRQSKKSRRISYENSLERLSSEGLKTVDMVNRKSKKRPFNTIPGTSSAVFDNTWPSYKWLRAGWIVEERTILSHGRLYRYYYDQLGQLYTVRYDVELMYANTKMSANIKMSENAEKNAVLIVLDK